MSEHHKRAAALGGAITKATYGISHFQEIGRLGGAKTKSLGPEHYAAIGRKGAATRVAMLRNAALEEAALECLKVLQERCASSSFGLDANLAKACVDRIRALRTT